MLPTKPISFSDKNLEQYDPPTTAKPVLNKCPENAPNAVSKGFNLALNAIFEKNERSPISDTKTSTNALAN